jgi:hypothetical protein
MANALCVVFCEQQRLKDKRLADTEPVLYALADALCAVLLDAEKTRTCGAKQSIQFYTTVYNLFQVHDVDLDELLHSMYTEMNEQITHHCLLRLPKQVVHPDVPAISGMWRRCEMPANAWHLLAFLEQDALGEHWRAATKILRNAFASQARQYPNFNVDATHAQLTACSRALECAQATALDGITIGLREATPLPDELQAMVMEYLV